MAHYKRGKCRQNCPRAIRGSDTSWRARWGFKPVRLPPREDWPESHSSEWHDLFHPRGRHGNRGRKIGGTYSQMSSYPAWWDRVFHTRRKRAEVRRLERKILQSKIDPDDTVWPLSSRKPTLYYW